MKSPTNGRPSLKSTSKQKRAKIPKAALGNLVHAVYQVVHCPDNPRMTWEQWEEQIRNAFVEAGTEEDLEEFVSFFQLEEYRNSLEEV